MPEEIMNAFHHPLFLTAMYGQRWRHYHAISPMGNFYHAPVLQPIGNSCYHYAEAWRGYAEPQATSERSQIRDAFSTYSTWCRKQSLICELLRLDPLGKLRQLADDIPNGRVVEGQPVAVLDKPDSMEQYRAQLPAACQRNLRSAKKQLEVRLIAAGDHHTLAEAAMLHSQTLQRVHAADKWFVQAANLQLLSSTPGFFNVGVFNRSDNSIVSFAGCLQEGRRLHVLLVGNGLRADCKGASDLLYESIVALAVERCPRDSVNRIYFGGGRSLDGSDSLMRFKLKFSLGRAVSCSYLALIHDAEAAASLSLSQVSESPVEPLSELQRQCFPFLNQE